MRVPRSPFEARRLWLLAVALLALALPRVALADPAPYDLAGPKLTVTVTRGDRTLPIGEVPNLAAGDRILIKADLPATQSVRYLLVAAFLRGATNPPPEDWFFNARTWTQKGQGGLKVVVPAGAQQMLVFLAPDAGGNLSAITDAVHARPGVFVRASQDLNQASLDRSRLNAFLSGVHRYDRDEQDHLQEVSPLLARSLAIKLNADCLKKTPELQAACLTEGQGALVLSDGQSTSIVQALTSGQSADLINQLSITRQAGSGYYSPYIGAVMDMARILDSFHTAQFQFAPAITTTQGDQLSLILNTPPSFRNPMSILLTAMPAVEPPQIPPLRAVDARTDLCIDKPGLVLGVEGAPLAFSTHYAHDMVLHLVGRDEKSLDIPVRANPEKGGFEFDAAKLDTASLNDATDAVLIGQWGFDRFEGPHFHVELSRPAHWSLSADDQQSLVAGRDDVIHIASPKAVCVAEVALRPPGGDAQKVEWKASRPDELTVTLPLKDAQPGAAVLLVKQYGPAPADEVALQTFTRASRLDGFTYRAGEPTGLLKGARLDEVAGLTFHGIAFKPGDLTTANGADELSMTADPQALAKLKIGDAATAKVAFKAGRTATLKATVEAPRPRVVLISKSTEPPAQTGTRRVELADDSELEQGATLTFSLRAAMPASFAPDMKIEIAGRNGEVLTTLTQSKGLVLEDDKVALATVKTAEAFTPSTYGPLKFRLVTGGDAGDWQPLATLVRLPTLKDLKCSPAPPPHCVLTGANLFLIDALATDRGFEHPIPIPEGFTGASIPLPRTAARQLYVRLRDAPSVVNPVTTKPEESGGF